MYRRTLIWLFGILVCILHSGCTDYSYKGMYGITETEDGIDPHKVLMFVGKSNDITEGTKGTGAVDDAGGLAGRYFYVYSFQKGNEEASYSETSIQNPTTCFIDASIDDPASVQGRKVYWDQKSGLVEWHDDDAGPLYYPDGDALENRYDFFAYYVDDMDLEEGDFHRSGKSVSVDIEIDGSQDVMSSFARPSDEELRYGLEDYGNQVEAGKEYAYRKECSFSWYTASINIHPTFVFRRHLVKLDFKIVPGGTPGLTKDVRIEKIEVYSKSRGRFTVVDGNPDNMGIRFEEERASLELKEKDGSDFCERMISTIPYDDPGDVPAIDDLGSLLVAPDMDYMLYVTLSETRDGEHVIAGERNELHIFQGKTPGYDEGDEEKEDGGRFEAGGEYLITLTIYGKMDVTASVDLMKWDEGGDYIYDFDEEHWENTENNL